MALPRRMFLGAAIAAALAGPLCMHAAMAAGPQVGKPAPLFTGTDADGRTVRLEDYKGKTVVLEWTNHDCPFVMKHYGGQAMQACRRSGPRPGIVWLSVISSAPGEQGAVDGQAANRLTQTRAPPPPLSSSTHPARSVGLTLPGRRRTVHRLGRRHPALPGRHRR